MQSVTLNCLVCNKPFKAYQCLIRAGKEKYCSKECCQSVTLWKKGVSSSPATEIKKGSKLPESWKQKMKGRKVWNKNTKGLCKPNSGTWYKGLHASPGTEWKVGTPKELHPRWEGGKSSESYPTTFNQELKHYIRSRDNFTCRSCGVPQVECTRLMHVHHIDYNKKNISENNLITLCVACHMKTNVNRNVWLCFFKEVMSNAGYRRNENFLISEAV